MGNFSRAALAAAIASVVAHGPASAVLVGQGTTPTGAGFASACAGNSFPGMGSVGNALNNGDSTSYGAAPGQQVLTCSAVTSAVGGIAATGTLSSNATYYGNAYNNSASATAGVGVIKLQSQNAGSSATAFSGAGAQGGWNDSLTLTGGGANGTQGIFVVPIHVSGTMSSLGVGANGLFEVGIYKNHAIVQPYGATVNSVAYNLWRGLNTAFNPHINQNSVAVGTILFGWDYQMKPYGAVDYGPGALTTTSLTIDEIVKFVIPFTWGQAFTLGIYAGVTSGETASGGAVVANTASGQFQNTIYWSNGAYALAADGSGGAITGFSISATSGANYFGSFVPEPASLGLFGLGVGVAAALRRRRSHAA